MAEGPMESATRTLASRLRCSGCQGDSAFLLAFAEHCVDSGIEAIEDFEGVPVEALLGTDSRWDKVRTMVKRLTKIKEEPDTPDTKGQAEQARRSPNKGSIRERIEKLAKGTSTAAQREEFLKKVRRQAVLG